MRRRGLNIRKALLKIIMPVLRKLPPRAASRFVAGIGHTEYKLVSKLRVRFDHAVSRGEQYLGCHWNDQTLGRRLAGNQIRWRTRDQLLDGLSDAQVAALFGVEGLDLLDAARSEGRGVILLGNHFGAHMMPAHWLLRNGYPLRLFMERPHHISQYLNREFDSDGPLGQRKLFISRKADPSEAAGSIMRAARVLKAGMLLQIAGDVRWTGQHTAPARFLGHEYNFSSTWATLAAMTGAPVVPVFCRMDEDGSYHLEFRPAFHIPADAPKTIGIAAWVQTCLSEIEDRVRLDPANSNEYLFWADEAEKAVAG
jgi:KDO2-lipid IV(A) lauroyltransferase